MNQIEEYTAEEICAFLTTRAYSRTELPQLYYNDNLKDQVKKKLAGAGYEFVYDPISQYFDARIKREIRSLDHFLEGQLGTTELTTTAKALIAILWGLLILPQYDRNLRKDLEEEPYVTEEQLYETFKKHIGARKNLRKVLTLLRQYDFIRTVWGKNAIKAGPRLFTAIDSTLMYDRMKNRLIDMLLQENDRQKREVHQIFNEDSQTEKEEDIEIEQANG